MSRGAWAAVLGLTACTPSGTFLDVPDEIALIAWIRLDATGALLDASPLRPVAEAEVFVVAGEDDIVFVGYGPELAAIAGRSGLVSPAECAPRLPVPAWTRAAGSGTPAPVPALGADWVAPACPSEHLVCAPCPGGCSGDLTMFNVRLDTPRELRGMVRVSDDRLIATGPPDALVELVIDPERGIEAGPATLRTLATTTSTLTHTLAFDGTTVYAPTANDVVIALEVGGSTRAIAAPIGRMRVVAAIGGPVYAYGIGGRVVELTRGATVARERPDLPSEVYDLAVTRSEIFVLAGEGVFIFGDTPPQRIPLPSGFPPVGGRMTYENARIGLAPGDDPVIGVELADAYRFRRSEGAWVALGWPSERPAQPRAFLPFAGGVLIAGRSVANAGHVMLAFDDARCSSRAPAPVSAFTARPGDVRAYGVTNARPGYLLEVPAP